MFGRKQVFEEILLTEQSSVYNQTASLICFNLPLEQKVRNSLFSCSGITPDDQKRLVEEFSKRYPSFDRDELSVAVADQQNVQQAVIALTKLVFDDDGACLNALPEFLRGEFNQFHCFVVVLRVLCLLGPAVFVVNRCASAIIFTSCYKITHAISFWQCHLDHNEEK